MTTPVNLVTHTIKSLKPAMETTNGDFGIEFEAESHRRWDVNTPPGWSAKADNSLRHFGIEFVTRGAVTHANLSESVGRMCEVINSNDPLLDSPRTSVHVHLNMQDRSITQVTMFDIAYFVLEDFLLNLCAPHRRTTPFAVTARAAPMYIRDLDNAIKASDTVLSGFINWWQPNQHKYTSLNMCRLNDLGTVEQRSMHGNYNPLEVSAWCSCLFNLRAFVEKFKNPIEMCDYIYLHGPDVVLEEIAPNAATLHKMQQDMSAQDRLEVCEDALASVSRVVYSRTKEKWNKIHSSVTKGYFMKKPAVNIGRDAGIQHILNTVHAQVNRNAEQMRALIPDLDMAFDIIPDINDGQ